MPDVLGALATLGERGWALPVPAPDGPGWAVSARGWESLRSNPERSAAALGGPWWECCSPRDVATAVAQRAKSRALAAAAAACARAVRRQRASGIIAWAGPRELGVDPRDALPWGDLEARWQAGVEEARFAIHWDPPDAPPGLRAHTLSRWRRARQRSAMRPALVIVCGGERQLAEWLYLAAAEAGRRGSDALPPLLIAPAAVACGDYGVQDAVWANAAGRLVSLLDTVRWTPLPAGEETLPPRPNWHDNDVPRIGSLAESLAALERPPGRLARPQRAARALLALDGGALRALAWLAAQPWMSVADLAAADDCGRRVAGRRLAALRGQGLALRSHDGRWGLSERGMELCAAGMGMVTRPREFARITGCPYAEEAPDQAPRHDAGVSRMLGAIAHSGRAAGAPLETWLDERRWRRDISDAAPVPDGACALRGGAGFVVEYERSLPNADAARAKLEAWERWYERGAWQSLFPRRPVLLFTHDAESRAAGPLRAALQDAPAALPAAVASMVVLERAGVAAPRWLLSGGRGVGSALALALSD